MVPIIGAGNGLIDPAVKLSGSLDAADPGDNPLLPIKPRIPLRFMPGYGHGLVQKFKQNQAGSIVLTIATMKTHIPVASSFVEFHRNWFSGRAVLNTEGGEVLLQSAIHPATRDLSPG
ncbi:MAG: hypothetical protein IPO35_18495 [Uliginosibacterium sp.]|nr:hypothetical protein [Uliginosibacterium sp.]